MARAAASSAFYRSNKAVDSLSTLTRTETPTWTPTLDWRPSTDMFVDEVDIHVAAGHGGRGAMSFRREKFVPRGGPDGGNGGPGGSVYLVANSNLNTLLSFRFQKQFEAGRGAHGEGSNRTGRTGADVVLEVPVGTV